jgi:hypothetical protein
MITWKLKMWRGAGVAAVLAAAACGSEQGGEKGGDGDAGENSAAHGEAGEAAIGESGGEHGEAGVSQAYAGVAGDQRTALRLQHLRGFLMVAEMNAEGDLPADSAMLIEQGLIEVYDPAADQFGGLNVAPVREAGANPDVSRQQMAHRIQAGYRALEAARAPLRVDYADLSARMIEISSGLYQHVVQEDFVDPIEYQHSLGAALAAREALVRGEQALAGRNRQAYEEALAEVNAFVALWPSAAAPETPSPYQDVVRQASRVRLALSPFLN